MTEMKAVLCFLLGQLFCEVSSSFVETKFNDASHILHTTFNGLKEAFTVIQPKADFLILHLWEIYQCNNLASVSLGFLIITQMVKKYIFFLRKIQLMHVRSFKVNSIFSYFFIVVDCASWTNCEKSLDDTASGKNTKSKFFLKYLYRYFSKTVLCCRYASFL